MLVCVSNINEKTFILSIKLINLLNNISALANYSAMSPIRPLITFNAILKSILFASSLFIKNKNLVLGKSGLKTHIDMTPNNIFIV